MKVQKAHFKKVIFLLLLLTGNMDFSFSAVKAISIEEKQQELFFTAELDQSLQKIQDESFPGIIILYSEGINYSSSLPFYLTISNAETQRTATYIRFCRYIYPALGSTKIIYPFHFFL